MVAVAVGVVLVLVAAVVAGVAVFGRPPTPQTATNAAGTDGAPVTSPSRSRDGAPPSGRRRVEVSAGTRLRSLLLLVLASVVIAAFVGVALSVVVVGFGLLVS